ncbi:MAG: phosphate ABC transporter permease subunit PstC [Pseudotabrizicola sp.]|uniref:phosphate ABC transporter permease subunit PstC n=1 Tax=Pseudotabrizicola sp. TaxID=2939647 RepID=UPI0027275C4C|nr:phosphate ABC transporter permease subunit PstC [Pseudotabrizicola sp.]MDO8881755.1 phosphate ABC transporter permease subunit PstC [Pseudotabrizicola sp.]MDP2081564.1 phosphate ABC transporter permease subunit PstC [Pseudotabrizicola sp.]MDZ7575767.1 phosphate ABC transporter permease subunit PstC [Pseudotabrizicola sp.]
MTLFAFGLLLAVSLFGFLLNRQAALSIRAGGQALHSLPQFHGGFSALLIFVPAFVVLILWLTLQGNVINAMILSGLPADAMTGLESGQRQLVMAEIAQLSRGLTFGTPEDWKIAASERLITLRATSSWLMLAVLAAITAAMLVFARKRVASEFRARQGVEGIINGLMIACSVVAILTTAGIVLSLVFESARFFSMVPLSEFLFGTNWEPQIPMRADQVAGAGAFGWLPVILGTMVITTIAMLVAVPIGLFSAIYLNEFASAGVRKVAKPLLEILAGVPTVVYGFFAVLTVAPALRESASAWGIVMSPNTALAAGGVMAIMLIPFISSFADDALSAVPQSLRDGSLALGATRSETVLKVLFPAAIPGIVGGILLAMSRAIGETMIVVMAAGLIATMTINPLDSVTTVTVQIVTLLIGDTSFDNPKTLAAFALGLMLFIVTLVINVFALRIVRKYREVYD